MDNEMPGDDGQEEQQTALLPKTFFGDDCEIGDIYKVKVVSKLEDELEVAPAGHDKKDNEDSNDDDMENPVDTYANAQQTQ